MKIVHINTFDYVNGASRAAYRLHQGLRRRGQDSTMYVHTKVTDDPHVNTYVQPSSFVSKLSRSARRLMLRNAMVRYEKNMPAHPTYFSQGREIYKGACRQIPGCDLIQLHWLTGFIDYKEFFSWLPRRLPMVWTLHDMANFTGGCAYDLGCGKFVSKCGSCPQLGSVNKADLSRSVWTRKTKLYSSLSPDLVHIVTPSRWLGNELGRSPLLGHFARSVIPYGLDTTLFQPRNRRSAREVFGIPADAIVVLFLSSTIDANIKGFRFLADALASFNRAVKIFLLSVGSGPAANIQGIPYVHLHSVEDDRLLSFVYSAADVFVAPSLADNLPNTVLESMACGTPIVAFSAGGIPDMVRPGVTGLLATVGDARELRAAIEEVITNDAKRAEMSVNCRQVALKEYEMTIQANRYIDLYGHLLKSERDLALQP